MSDPITDRGVWLFEYGEAYDDLRAAFYIDESSYSDSAHARFVVEAAKSALRRVGVIFEIEVTHGSSPAPTGLPTWEEFKQRHFVEGVPLPVRPRPKQVVVPPSWEAMNAELTRANAELRDELIRTVSAALPDADVFVTSDRGPLRQSAGSVDWSEEKFGFVVGVGAALGELPVVGAFEAVTGALQRSGWQLNDAEGAQQQMSCDGRRADFQVSVQVQPGRVAVRGYSPLYRAPAEPGSNWVTESRPRQS